jgi:hypothetical protein
MKALVIAAALAWVGIAGAAAPATFHECTGPVHVYAYGVACASAVTLVESAWRTRGRHRVGSWRLAGWRWSKVDGGLLGRAGTKFIDASVGQTGRIGTHCDSRGYVEGVTAYRVSCRDALSLVHRLPARTEPTWVARGFRWWAHPNQEASTVVGISGAGYIYVVV